MTGTIDFCRVAALVGRVMAWAAMTRVLAEMGAGGLSLDPLDPQGGLGVPAGAAGLFNFEPYNLLAGLVFGTLGWGAFVYGRKLELWQPRAIGIGLMIYPYFISNGWILWGMGTGLLVLLWFYHDE